MDRIEKAVNHARSQHETVMAEFQELLRIPSISTDAAYKEEVLRCANWIVAEMERIGFQNCRAMPSDGQPVVYGEWLQAGESKPTVLIYAHYDVQPADPLELWDTPPFEPTIRDGKLFARGARDDKAGVFVTLKAFQSMFAADGTLPVNVKLFFEGEEESGSPSMATFVQQHKELLKADLLVISDGGSPKGQPVLYYGLRGVAGAEVTVTVPIRDIHSGTYGGVVRNPAHVVGRIIHSFHDDDGRIQIDGFYDDVREMPPEEVLRLIPALEQMLPDMKHESGVTTFWGEALDSFIKRATALPTLDVNGLWGGYQGEGMKTIIPSQAGFKATMRLVPDQDPDEILYRFTQHLNQFVTDDVKIEIRLQRGTRAVLMPYEGPAVDALHAAYEATWGKRAMLFRAGGSIPIMAMFQQELDMPLLWFGVGIGENQHSPNEFIWVEYVYRCIETAIHFYYNVAERLGSA